MKIEKYSLHRLHLELPLPIGDSQVRFTDHWIVVLEITTDTGLTGVGFELQQGLPLPGLVQLRNQFEYSDWPSLHGQNPFNRALQISRPRGGNVAAAVLPLAIETACWDLMAKSLGLPLYRMLGGNDPKVRAYGSTLDFWLDDEQFRERLGDFKRGGFQAVKVKVGHPDADWDLRRLGIVGEVFGKEIDVMVDANEAWTPKEAIIRANLYAEAGFKIYWIEDPITREDYAGYRQLAGEIKSTRINTGEYLGFHGKRRLLENGGVDVLNVHGSVGMTRAAAYLAGDYGIPVSLGNTIMEIGVHLAASLPECLYMEFSDIVWNRLAQQGVRIEDGWAYAPDRAGHGIELDPEALIEFSRLD